MNNSIESAQEKIERGKRIKHIRESELHMSKIEFGAKIGVSGQFIGLVEAGKGNLLYPYIRNLMRLSGHSSDFILYGLDDTVLAKTQKILANYSDKQILECMKLIENLSIFIKKA